MIYLFIYLFLWPFLKIASFFCGPSRGSLVVQTAKIGDYLNTTPIIEALGEADVVIDKINEGFARNDRRVLRIELINDFRGSFLRKLGLCLKLYRRRYDAVYVVMPNAFNLFLGLCALPRRRATLRTYATGFTAGLLTRFYNRIVSHGRDDLTLDSYLKMLDGTHDSQSVWKLPAREKIPGTVCAAIANSTRKKIGVCLGTGNASKRIPASEWQHIFALLDEWDADVFAFGLESDRSLFQELQENVELKHAQFISLLGLFELQEIAANIARLDLFISSDTGLCYLADCYRVPIIVYAGPCHMAEQRPINPRVLIIDPPIPPLRASYIFDTLHKADGAPYYRTDASQINAMRQFISTVLDPRP